MMSMGNSGVLLSAPSSSSSPLVDDIFEDGCIICLEPFNNLNPPTVTECKHEYHLHCILEWSQRRRECPICSQILVLKDSSSQELLVESQSDVGLKPEQIPVNQASQLNYDEPHPDETHFEQGIITQLSSIASIARNIHSKRKQMIPLTSSTELAAFSESLKSKISIASTRYKESISRSTSSLKEKLIARNNSVKELSRGVQREMSAGLAGVGRMIDRLDVAQIRAKTRTLSPTKELKDCEEKSNGASAAKGRKKDNPTNLY